MLQLVCAKLCDVARKLGIILAEIFELTRVVPIDFSLDGVGASERRFSDISAVAAPSAKPATFHSGWSAVGRTRRSAISPLNRLRCRCS